MDTNRTKFPEFYRKYVVNSSIIINLWMQIQSNKTYLLKWICGKCTIQRTKSCITALIKSFYNITAYLCIFMFTEANVAYIYLLADFFLFSKYIKWKKNQVGRWLENHFFSVYVLHYFLYLKNCIWGVLCTALHENKSLAKNFPHNYLHFKESDGKYFNF